ncbi:MAG: M48 family metallopeptidase [Clostridia bacterium]|nr:M48 family metallopeptidase [Clostridia bacterium]
MSARAILILFPLIQVLFDRFLMCLVDEQRKKPLPPAVADVFDPERYQKFIAYKADYRKLGMAFTALGFLVEIPLILCGMYPWIEKVCNGNLYFIALLTAFIFVIPETTLSIVQQWISVFKIEEKYGMNKRTGKEFAKETVISTLFSVGVGICLTVGVIFICEHLSVWTNGFTLGWGKSFLIALSILAVGFLFFAILQLLSYFILRLQYHFIPMPEGELLDKINQLQEGSKKKVKKVNIYEESKKSTSKNAFLLKLFWHREFGIADNFMNENSERELLAVLSHEIGHLKHKKNVLNYLTYLSSVILFALVVVLIHDPAPVFALAAWIRNSFGTAQNNYTMIMNTIGMLLTPVGFLWGIFSNYRSRIEEYEADREAVKNGYGEELIGTFKRLSNDELVDVNPHPVIEFLEYDHPGMNNRIKAIHSAMQQ